MITELGHMALILAFCVALVQATVPMLGAARGTSRLDGGRAATPLWCSSASSRWRWRR